MASLNLRWFSVVKKMAWFNPQLHSLLLILVAFCIVMDMPVDVEAISGTRLDQLIRRTEKAMAETEKGRERMNTAKIRIDGKDKGEDNCDDKGKEMGEDKGEDDIEKHGGAGSSIQTPDLSKGEQREEGEGEDMNSKSRRTLSACMRGVDITEVYSPARINEVCQEYGLQRGSSLDLRI